MRVVLSVIMLMIAWAQAPAFSANYRLEAGDTIEVSVWQEPKLNRQVVVGPDGMISFPLVGHLRVQGQTLQSVERVLAQRLQSKYTSDLDVTVLLVTTTNTDAEKTAYVTGEVNKPGPFLLQTRTNVLQAIALAGGFGPFAARNRVVVHRTVRGQVLTFEFNYAEYSNGHDVSSNIDLIPGDVVMVPERGLFE